MVSAIILAYNRCPEVLITIANLKALRKVLPFSLEIIVVDNASKDNTVLQVKKQFPDVTLIERKINSGVSGWNDGFAVAKNKYLLVLDDDSHVERGLSDAVDLLERNEEVGIVAFNIVDTELKGDPNLREEDAWKDGQEIPGFIGCGALIRAEVYKRIGGFSEWLFIYTHEFDYAIRCLDAGYKVVYLEDALVVHRASKLNRTNKRLRLYSVRNEMGIVYKYFNDQRWKYIWKILLNNLKFIKREGFAAGYYVLQGAWQFMRMRKGLVHTPVKAGVQEFYANNFWATRPVLDNMKRRVRRVLGR